jgi:hypothetical protein
MATLLVRVRDAARRPLDDPMDVHLVTSSSDRTVSIASSVAGNATVRFKDLIDGQPYVVKVFPLRHRPVAQFAIPGSDDDPPVVQMYTPLHPERVRSVVFPEYPALIPELRHVLERSTVEGVAGQGQALYGALNDTQKAGLFNLFAKMSSLGFGEARTIWSFVDRLTRVRADRLFADVDPALRDLVKGAVAANRFREVSGSLHTPPPGFLPAGSFKTEEQFGNLQLTFFVSSAAPLTFKVDADIDDAAGLGHAFQVLRNWVTSGTTHPYDIHQILVFRQEVALPYELA